MSVDGAVEAILKMNPHPSAYASGYFDRRRHRWAFPIVKAPLTREIVELHVRGKRLLGAVGSDPEGYTTSVGLDLDKHTFTQQPETALKEFAQVASTLDVPIVVHTSRSGKGYQVRTIFEEKVPVEQAEQLYIYMLKMGGMKTEWFVDRNWERSDGLSVLSLPYNALMAKMHGGTLAIDPWTLKVLDREQQLHPVLHGPQLNLDAFFIRQGLCDAAKEVIVSSQRVPVRLDSVPFPASIAASGVS